VCPHPGGSTKCNLWCSHMVLRVPLDLDQYKFAEFHWYRSKKNLSTMWLHQKMQCVHLPECWHTCYTLRVANHYKLLENFVSCPLAEIDWYRSELTLRTLWLHHKMHFVHPLGCGHMLYSLRIKHHNKSLANFMSCFIANFNWSRSKGTLKSMWLHYKMHFVHPPGCGHTLYSLRIKHHYRLLANFKSCIVIDLDLKEPSKLCRCITWCIL
jgi:hypothetical protein